MDRSDGKRRTLTQEVVEGILDIIKSGKVQVNEAIPTEGQIAQMFNVSRTAVREATRTLIAHGVLETRRGIGTFLRDPAPGPLRSPDLTTWSGSSKALMELLEFRMILEPQLAALAARRATDEDLAELKRCVIELEKGIARGIKPAEDLGFHLALARATHNGSLIDVAAMISRFYESDPYLPTSADVTEHDAIFEAVRKKNPTLAERKMRVHLDTLQALYSLRASS